MLCLRDHQTMAFKDQSTIPKANFIEIGVYKLLGFLSFKAEIVLKQAKSHYNKFDTGSLI